MKQVDQPATVESSLPATVASSTAMPIALKLLLWAGVALTVFLTAMVFAPSSRGYGGPGGWGAGILYFAGAVLTGGTVTLSYFIWLLYRVLRATKS
ncbi:hypothetical protein [Chitinolyticbacter albus]|uniref:hypothetical protein n=1 Tax=Chitinolyticbacter albus TaxID=2961951 RepID=UPI00210BAA90|nr:hypothetical protein [Chitinolyticbacter albus]